MVVAFVAVVIERMVERFVTQRHVLLACVVCQDQYPQPFFRGMRPARRMHVNSNRRILPVRWKPPVPRLNGRAARAYSGS